MEEGNFRAFMEFLRFLESEDIKGRATERSMEELAGTAISELTTDQRLILDKEFPGLVKPGIYLVPKDGGDY